MTLTTMRSTVSRYLNVHLCGGILAGSVFSVLLGRNFLWKFASQPWNGWVGYEVAERAAASSSTEAGLPGERRARRLRPARAPQPVALILGPAAFPYSLIFFRRTETHKAVMSERDSKRGRPRQSMGSILMIFISDDFYFRWFDDFHFWWYDFISGDFDFWWFDDFHFCSDDLMTLISNHFDFWWFDDFDFWWFWFLMIWWFWDLIFTLLMIWWLLFPMVWWFIVSDDLMIFISEI